MPVDQTIHERVIVGPNIRRHRLVVRQPIQGLACSTTLSRTRLAQSYWRIFSRAFSTAAGQKTLCCLIAVSSSGVEVAPTIAKSVSETTLSIVSSPGVAANVDVSLRIIRRCSSPAPKFRRQTSGNV